MDILRDPLQKKQKFNKKNFAYLVVSCTRWTWSTFAASYSASCVPCDTRNWISSQWSCTRVSPVHALHDSEVVSCKGKEFFFSHVSMPQVQIWKARKSLCTWILLPILYRNVILYVILIKKFSNIHASMCAYSKFLYKSHAS